MIAEEEDRYEKEKFGEEVKECAEGQTGEEEEGGKLRKRKKEGAGAEGRRDEEKAAANN